MTPPEMPFSRYRNIAISRFRLENKRVTSALHPDCKLREPDITGHALACALRGGRIGKTQGNLFNYSVHGLMTEMDIESPVVGEVEIGEHPWKA